VNLAFESPMPRGFDTRERAVEGAKEHVRTQFARIGIDPDDVTLEVEKKTTTNTRPWSPVFVSWRRPRASDAWRSRVIPSLAYRGP